MAKDFPEYTFAIADEEDYSDELKSLGLSDSGEEVNVGILGDGGKKFAMEPDEFDSEVLRDFIMAFKKGELDSKLSIESMSEDFTPHVVLSYRLTRVECLVCCQPNINM